MPSRSKTATSVADLVEQVEQIYRERRIRLIDSQLRTLLELCPGTHSDPELSAYAEHLRSQITALSAGQV